jgi:hypothetical protein
MVAAATAVATTPSAAAAAALDTGFCHLIGSISSDGIGWIRSICFCQSKTPLFIYPGL